MTTENLDDLQRPPDPLSLILPAGNHNAALRCRNAAVHCTLGNNETTITMLTTTANFRDARLSGCFALAQSANLMHEKTRCSQPRDSESRPQMSLHANPIQG
jgi:hypothetical protein